MRAMAWMKVGIIAAASIVMSSSIGWADAEPQEEYFSGAAPSAAKKADPSSRRAKEMGKVVEHSAEGTLRVGMATADITPDWPVLLPYG